MEKYIKPHIEVIKFDVDDVIVTSAEGSLGEIGEEGLGDAAYQNDIYYSADR